MPDIKQKITWEELVQIENEFNTFQFEGVPVGSLLAASFYQYWWIGFKEYTYYLQIINHLRLIRYRYFGKKNILSFALTDTLNDKYVFAVSSNSERLTSFFTPLKKFINIEECVFTGTLSNIENINDIKYVKVPVLSNINNQTWRVTYKKYKNKFDTILYEIAQKYNLPKNFIDEQKLFFINQTKSIIYFDTFFEKHKPKCILTDHDRTVFNSTFILSAQKQHIPTFTFIHGNTYPNGEGFYPVIADKIFCWGQKHYLQFLKLNVPKEKLLITGNTKMDAEVRNNQTKLKSKFKIALEKKIILLATNNIELRKRHTLASTFAEFLDKNELYKGIIKLHPTESIKDYTEIIERYPEILMLESNTLDYEDSFSLADIVAIHNSLFGLEALVKGKPLLVFDVLDEDLFIGEELINEAGCPSIRTQEDFNKHIENVKVTEQQKIYIKKYYSYYKEEAALNISKQLTQ